MINILRRMKKVPCRIDESITPFCNTTLRPVCWVDKSDESIFFFLVFFWRKLHLISMFFVQYSVIQLRYFWWNYFLNKLVCLIVRWDLFVCWLWYIARVLDDHRLAECRYKYIFWWHMFFNNSFYIALHGAPINIFFWTSFSFSSSVIY